MIQKVDIHTHILPKTLPAWSKKFGVPGFISLNHTTECKAQMLKSDGSVFREVDHRLWDKGVRLKECDRDSVQLQVLSTVPVMFAYGAKPAHALEVASYLNDHIADIVNQHPTRFAGLATVPLQDPELACIELTRSIRELGLKGVQIGSHVNDWNLNQKELEPFFAEAERLGAAVFVHPWDMPIDKRNSKYWLPWLVGMPSEVTTAICSMIFGGIFEKFPKLRVAFAHGGGSFAGTSGRIEHGYHARPDLCAVDNAHAPSKYFGKFFVDALVHDATMLKVIVEKFGADRVALGSDYPFPLGEATPGKLIESISEFTPLIRQKLLRDTALHWLGSERIAP